MKKGKIKIIFVFMILVGLMFFGGLFMYIKTSNEFFANAEKTIAVISDIKTDTKMSNGERKTTHYTYVTYEIDGKEYRNVSLGYYSSNMYIGKKITVYYNPATPYEVKTKDGNVFMTIILGTFGAVFTFIGIFGIVSSGKKKNISSKCDKLYEAEIISVTPNYSLNINGMTPYTLECEAYDPENGERLYFVYKYVYNDPRDEGIMSVPVYVDSNNKEHYIVDYKSAVQRVRGV